MDIAADTVAQIVARADAAARRRDVAAARLALEQATRLAPEDASLWIKLASMERSSGRPDLALTSVRRALTLLPLDFLALLTKAVLLEELGEPSAGEAYGIALAQRPAAIPPALENAVARAEAAHRLHRAAERTRLAAAMADAESAASDEERSRLRRFRSNVLRETRIYHSEPTHFHYPGLVEREFHDAAAFPWLADLEAATDGIIADLARVMAAERAELVPYVQYDADIPMGQWSALNGSTDWTAIHLLRNGRRVERNARHCPTTMMALARLPQPVVAGRMPNAMFSLLKPGTTIPPHTGVANTRLVCHLPLIVPDGCWFRVGAETRAWQRGSAFVFDDTIEHEAANPSAALRVVLIVDIWHPGLSAAERDGVAALMAASDAAGGTL